jgi:hypothetical protein
MLMSRIAFAFAAGLMAMSGAAMAEDEVVLSASHAAKLPTEAEQAKAKADAAAKAEAAAKPASTQAQLLALQAAAQPAANIDRTAMDVAPKPAGYEVNGRTIHGGAGVSIGTGGYKSGYVYTLIPIGETGTLGLAYSQTDYGKNGGLLYGDSYGDPYDGYGYGYGRSAYGQGYGRGYGRGLRGGTSKSLAVSLDMTGDASEPEGCAPGFRDGSRYVEPVWVTNLNGGRTCQSDRDASDPARLRQ